MRWFWTFSVPCEQTGPTSSYVAGHIYRERPSTFAVIAVDMRVRHPA